MSKQKINRVVGSIGAVIGIIVLGNLWLDKRT